MKRVYPSKESICSSLIVFKSGIEGARRSTTAQQRQIRYSQESNEHRSIMQCPKCDRGELRRTARKGFLERQIYARFGYYPWKCPTCKYRKLRKTRGKRSTDRKF